MWVHRRSEEPSCTAVQCYWQKSRLSRVGTTLFLSKANLTVDPINKIEAETRDQFKNELWYEIRYGRVTASNAYEVSRCQTDDGTLISIIMGGKIPDTPAMQRGRYLENEVREIVSKKLGKNIKNCGPNLNK
nr:unnamed protein product [Callosobruchus chinensis]